MEFKVLVAGAGHGGLVAAFALAKAGADVTVYEKRPREGLGYDWDDTMTDGTFEKVGLPTPPPERFFGMEHMGYLSTDKRLLITTAGDPSPHIVYVDRKYLLAFLFEQAEKAGVKLVFGAEILGPRVEKTRVTGLDVRLDGAETFVKADLVIDAAGVYSPVRRKLPKYLGVEREIDPKRIFRAWRAYYEKPENENRVPGHLIYFYHCGRPGMDWAITRKNVVDLLVGGFGGLTDADVEESVADFRKDYPYMSDKLLRGGTADDIPLAKTPALFVADGYAAVGNSASMTEPLSGSGLDLSMRAGRLLADAVVDAGFDASAKTLWGYERAYFLSHSARYLSDLVIKDFLSSLESRDVDFFFNFRILTAKELRGDKRYTPSELLQKLNLLRRPDLLGPLLSTAKKLAALEKIKAQIPETFDRAAILRWKKLYDKI